MNKNKLIQILKRILPSPVRKIISKSISLFKSFLNLFPYSFYFIKSLFVKIPVNSKIHNKKIIIKCDDLSDYSKNVKKFDKIIKKYKILVSWGVIGNSLENPSKKYSQFLNKELNGSNYHFFNHGYYHNWKPGEYEFDGPSVEYQADLINKTNELFYKITNSKLDTFGAPCNHIDNNTVKALSSISQIKYWYYGIENKYNHIFIRTANIEKEVGSPDYKFFLNEINSKEIPQILTLQCHPNGFELKHFLEIKLIFKFLLKNNCTFIKPSEI